jgi:hypothetical protein
MAERIRRQQNPRMTVIQSGNYRAVIIVQGPRSVWVNLEYMAGGRWMLSERYLKGRTMKAAEAWADDALTRAENGDYYAAA